MFRCSCGRDKEYWSEFDKAGFCECGRETMNEIKGVHPKLADAISSTLNEAKARGLSVGMYSGLRTDNEKQMKLYELGRTVKNEGATKDKPMGLIVTNAKTIWDTFHGFGLACDIVYKDKSGNWTWDKTQEQWEDLGKVGEIFGLEWGGRWTFLDNRDKLIGKDYPHFQMTGSIKNIKEAKEIYDTKGIDELWKLI